jgi:hypothetical protein
MDASEGQGKRPSRAACKHVSMASATFLFSFCLVDEYNCGEVFQPRFGMASWIAP